MPFQSNPLELRPQQRADLEEIARSQSLPAGFVLRAKIVLLLAEGWSYQAVAGKLDTSTPTVGKWKNHCLEHGLDTVEARHAVQIVTADSAWRIRNARGSRRPLIRVTPMMIGSGPALSLKGG